MLIAFCRFLCIFLSCVILRKLPFIVDSSLASAQHVIELKSVVVLRGLQEPS